MNLTRMFCTALFAVLLCLTCLAAWSQPIAEYSSGELDELLAPIALYPDPLMAQLLPAATFSDQLSEARSVVITDGDTYSIDQQGWDVSVKSIAHYPSVLRMMTDKPDWTTAVGQGYIDQPEDVMRSIQRLRARAYSYGYLRTNSRWRVYHDGGYYRIVPVQSQYLYVPVYDPDVVYVRRYGSSISPGITFGLGLLIGSWLNRDLDWHHHRIFYHGWRGDGWIGQSRRHVSLHDDYYVNNRFMGAPINLNRGVRTRDIEGFRNRMREHPRAFFGQPKPQRPTRSFDLPHGRVPQVRPSHRPAMPNIGGHKNLPNRTERFTSPRQRPNRSLERPRGSHSTRTPREFQPSKRAGRPDMGATRKSHESSLGSNRKTEGANKGHGRNPRGEGGPRSDDSGDRGERRHGR